MSSVLLILLSLAFALDGCNVNTRDRIGTRQSKDECTSAKAIRYNFLTDSSVTTDPYCNCSLSGFGVVRTIPYSCVADACGLMHVDLSSACVRCGMCMAIAEEINQTLLEIHDMMAPDDWLNDTESTLLLRTICDQSFRHHGLREIDGKRFISDPLPDDKLIASSADGLWEKNLKNMCHEYLDEIQELQLYSNWREWCEGEERASSLEDILCRNEINNLRDCRGIDNIHKRQMLTKMVGARVKILTEYNNCR